eukprot:220784-Rhodomonas_salina.1
MRGQRRRWHTARAEDCDLMERRCCILCSAGSCASEQHAKCEYWQYRSGVDWIAHPPRMG